MADLPKPNKWGTNTGHGHVWVRQDGVKARCGGPRLCKQCQADQKAPILDPPSMTRAALAAIEARVAALHEGEWTLVKTSRFGHDRMVDTWYIKRPNGVGVAVQPTYSSDVLAEADFALIANAPTDLAALLAHIRTMESEREAEIAAAVAAERERCVREVEISMASARPSDSTFIIFFVAVMADLRNRIRAAAIREPKP